MTEFLAYPAGSSPSVDQPVWIDLSEARVLFCALVGVRWKKRMSTSVAWRDVV